MDRELNLPQYNFINKIKEVLFFVNFIISIPFCILYNNLICYFNLEKYFITIGEEINNCIPNSNVITNIITNIGCN